MPHAPSLEGFTVGRVGLDAVADVPLALEIDHHLLLQHLDEQEVEFVRPLGRLQGAPAVHVAPFERLMWYRAPAGLGTQHVHCDGHVGDKPHRLVVRQPCLSIHVTQLATIGSDVEQLASSDKIKHTLELRLRPCLRSGRVL